MHMKGANSLMGLFGVLLMVGTTVSDAWAESTTVDGITWTYTVKNGEASLGSGYGTPAVATSTTGNITIPSTLDGYRVTSIGYYAFYGCSGLESVTIGEGVATIENYAFLNCNKLTSIIVDAKNPSYSSLDGVLFSRDKSVLLAFPGGKPGPYVIPESVTAIGHSAFYGCNGLESMVIPHGVTSIGSYAFYGCSNLASVVIPAGVTNIGSFSLRGCSALTNIVVDPRNPSYSSLDGVLFSRDKTMLIVYPDGKQGNYAIPGNVTAIGDHAFYSCNGLTNVTLPEGVANIGNHSFSSCSNLAGVTIPDGVTNIGYSAFSCCSSLASVQIGESARTIGNSAFWGCSRLTNVTIGSGVTRIGLSVFYGCKRLPAINVAEGNTVYASRDGMLFSKDMSTLVCCPPGKAGTCIIPEDVSSIAMNSWFDFAFAGCTRLTAFEVADGNAAFVSCDDMLFSKNKGTLICCPGGKPGVCSIPEGVTSIGPGAFSWCSGLKSVSVSDSLQSIGEFAFYFCSGIETLFLPLSWQGKSLDDTRIRPGCRIIYGTRDAESMGGMKWHFFTQDGSVTVLGTDGSGEVVIPGQLGGFPVTGIAPYAFYGCKELSGVVIPAGVTNIGPHAFCGCEGLVDVAIPSGVTEIGDFAFSGCKSLTNIVIPDTVQKIGQHAFHGCAGLTGLTIGSGVTDIGKYAFAKCSGLPRVSIPGNAKTIGDHAFYKCTGLGELVLQNGVERMGSLAFADCDGLAFVTIPASVAELGDHPFAGCKGLLGIAVAPENGAYESPDGVLCSKGGTTLVGLPAGREEMFILPDGVSEIGKHAFDGCDGLTALEVGGGNARFASRNGALFSKDMARLWVCPAGKAGAFAVPEGVECIGEGAFAGCRELTRILISGSVTNMGTNSLERCNGLVALFVPEAWDAEGAWKQRARLQEGVKLIHGTLLSEIVDGVEWHFFAEDGGAVVLPGDYGAEVEIPAVLGGLPVTRIGEYAFYGCGELEKVAIPGSVTNVGDYAFFGCERLEGVTLPDSVQSIGKWAFGGCKGLKNIKIPEGVESIGDRAFFGCSGLPEAAIPDSVNRIGVNAFFGNSELTALEVGASNANYASRDGVLFSKDMERLLWCPDGKTGEYVVPEGVKSLACRAFGDCIGLTAGTMPESVEKIGRNAFYGCRGMAVLYVPASWEGEPGWLEMLARAKLPEECRIVYLKDNPEETTSTTPVPVPFKWLEENAKAILDENDGNYEAAANAQAANDRPVWECYLVGLSTTNEAAVFKLKSFSFENGQPVMKWDPDLNEDGTTNRLYRVWARSSVEVPEAGDSEATEDGWRDVTGQESTWVTNGWRFFRVGVEMP